MLLPLWTIHLLLLPTGTWTQSGDRDTDMEPTVYCTSHISYHEGNTITCQLVPGQSDLEDDEDNDSDNIKTITACCEKLPRCVNASGDTVSSKNLNAHSVISLTVLSTRGHCIQTELRLKNIIKPKSPRVWNVTLNQDHAVVYIQIPYNSDYLKLQNQQFQLQLWSLNSNETHNMTSDSMNIAMDHLRKGTHYHVKVRAIPIAYFQGTWSDWGHTYSFKTPPPHEEVKAAESTHVVVWSVIPLTVVVILIVVFLWKNKLLTYMWPSIPHPKTTIAQICRPNNGLLLIYKPEEFSSLNVYPIDQSEAASHCETQPVLSTDGTEDTPSSAQTTNTSVSSVPTEELELLSQSSSSDGEQGSTQAEHVHNDKGTFGTSGQQENSYVTMSSFYQIKNNGMVYRTQP